MLENDFLALLVDETFKLQKNGEATVSSLERKLKDYDLSFLRGEFIPQVNVLRFETSFGTLDIPVNWSVFNFHRNPAGTVITEDRDPDHFLAILRNAWNKKLTQLLVTHADGFCYIVGLKSGEEAHLHDLLNPVQMLRAA